MAAYCNICCIQLAGWLAAFDAIRDRVWAARMIVCASKSYSNHGSATRAMVWRIVGAIPDIAVKSWNAALRRAGYNHSMCRGRLASEQLAVLCLALACAFADQDCFSRSETTASTARSTPLFKSIGFIPAATDLFPSLTID